MAYSGKTPNYNLPQIEGTDKVNWFDLNGAFTTIDTGMESNKQEAETANQKADNNTNAIASLTETVTNQGQTGVENTAEIEKLKQTTSLHTTHLNEIDVINQNQNTRIQALESGESDVGTEIVQIKKDLTEVSTVAANNAQNISSAEVEIQALQSITDTMQDDLSKIGNVVDTIVITDKMTSGTITGGSVQNITAVTEFKYFDRVELLATSPGVVISDGITFALTLNTADLDFKSLLNNYCYAAAVITGQKPQGAPGTHRHTGVMATMCGFNYDEEGNSVTISGRCVNEDTQNLSRATSVKILLFGKIN